MSSHPSCLVVRHGFLPDELTPPFPGRATAGEPEADRGRLEAASGEKRNQQPFIIKVGTARDGLKVFAESEKV